ncbi:MAG TPA: HEAT repeat domain-containing protein [Candidatus Eremiobacteraeota bacterium]|nr:MAG: hypothetical protein BWY64_03285 [bacterium ADurb.Bin363]HPZ06690.1 HEAT repeat domain-containing protein [Candidatus Eremiobacteraeota bacterium]
MKELISEISQPGIPMYLFIILIVFIIIVPLIIILIFRKKSGKNYNFERVSDCISALNDNREEIRVRACWSLLVHKSPEAEEPLERLLLDSSKFVRGAASSALGSLKRESSIRALEDAIKLESDEHTKAQMKKAVRRIMGEEVPVHNMAESLDDMDTIVVKTDSPFDKLPERKSKKEKKSLFRKEEVIAPDITSLLIPEDISLNKPGLSAMTAKLENLISTEQPSSSCTLEIKIDINSQTEEGKEILKKMQELRRDSKNFTFNITFNFKEQ